MENRREGVEEAVIARDTIASLTKAIESVAREVRLIEVILRVLNMQQMVSSVVRETRQASGGVWNRHTTVGDLCHHATPAVRQLRLGNKTLHLGRKQTWMEKKTLSAETLELLGDDLMEDSAVGPEFHNTIAERWAKLLKSGMSKELKQQLLKKYSPASNCPTLKVPVLNPEVKSAMLSVALKKDEYQRMGQDQLGKAISAVGGSLTELLRGDKSGKLDEKMLITAFSDAGRILTDLHYRKSVTGRAFITPGLSPVVKTIADESPVGALLFGENFSDRVKTVKAMERSTKDIQKQASVRKQPAPLTTTRKGYGQSSRSTTSHLNSRTPL